jgi:hypothetical protein
MSVWGDILDRGAGETMRKEDLVASDNFRDLYPEKLSVNPIKLDMSGFVDALNKLRKENLILNKSLKNLEKSIKKLKYERLG